MTIMLYPGHTCKARNRSFPTYIPWGAPYYQCSSHHGSQHRYALSKLSQCLPLSPTFSSHQHSHNKQPPQPKGTCQITLLIMPNKYEHVNVAAILVAAIGHLLVQSHIRYALSQPVLFRKSSFLNTSHTCEYTSHMHPRPTDKLYFQPYAAQNPRLKTNFSCRLLTCMHLIF